MSVYVRADVIPIIQYVLKLTMNAIIPETRIKNLNTVRISFFLGLKSLLKECSNLPIQ